MKKGLIIAAAFILLLVIGVLYCVGRYNSLVGMDEGVKNALGAIETDLQRRADLIPNLVTTVKGAAAHETEVIEAVTDARAKMAGASTAGEMAGADAELTSALSRLLVVVENYPELKANENFRDLMTQLEGAENRIGVARKDYNNAARSLNEAIRRFPTNIIANMTGFVQVEYFQADEGAQEVPQVEF
jgi:LemA protein